MASSFNEELVVTKDTKPDNAAEVMKKFLETTGFTLQFAEDDTSPATASGQGTGVFQPTEIKNRMENNQAIQMAKQFGKEHNVTIYKASIKMQSGDPFMELHFISPQVAGNFQQMMQKLNDYVGMNVQPAKQLKQNEIIRITKKSIPADWNLKGNPPIHMDRARVSIKIAAAPPEEAREEVAAGIKAETGYRLELK